MTAAAARIRQQVAEAQRSARLPTVSAAVVRGSDEVAAVRLGTPPPGAATQYRVGSITKTFTAVAVLQLRDEGRLGLDDPLAAHLPRPVAGGGALRLRDLLGHRSGLRREPGAPFWEASERTARELLEGLAADDLVLPAGRAWHYSNVAFALLGQVVEHHRAAPFAEALRRHVLDPLGLRDTTWLPRAPAAEGFRVGVFADTITPEPVTDAGAMGAAGQLWSTPGDLCRWGAFLAAPDPSVLEPATLDEMCDPVAIADPEAWTVGSGLGLQLFRRGERVLVGHGGSMPGFLAGLAVHRRSGVVAAVCTNAWQATDASGLACDLVTTVLDSDPPAEAPWVPSPVPDGVEELLGTWWWRGVQLAASVRDGVLAIGRAADPRGPRASTFAPAGPDRFVGRSGAESGEVLEVVRGPDGAVRLLSMGSWLLTRDPHDPAGAP